MKINYEKGLNSIPLVNRTTEINSDNIEKTNEIYYKKL